MADGKIVLRYTDPTGDRAMVELDLPAAQWELTERRKAVLELFDRLEFRARARISFHEPSQEYRVTTAAGASFALPKALFEAFQTGSLVEPIHLIEEWLRRGRPT